MTYALMALLFGLAWMSWFILQLPLWTPLAASAALALSGRLSRVPSHFRQTVAFGVPAKGTMPRQTSLARYFDELEKLGSQMRNARDRTPAAGTDTVAADIRATNDIISALLETTDPVGKRLLAPLLEHPVQVARSTPGHMETETIDSCAMEEQ